MVHFLGFSVELFNAKNTRLFLKISSAIICHAVQHSKSSKQRLCIMLFMHSNDLTLFDLVEKGRRMVNLELQNQRLLVKRNVKVKW